MAGSLYAREVGVLAEVSVTEQVLQEISKFPEILGKLSMRKQCMCTRLFSPHPHTSLGTRLRLSLLGMNIRFLSSNFSTELQCIKEFRFYKAKIATGNTGHMYTGQRLTVADRCATEAFSPTCAVHTDDCEGW